MLAKGELPDISEVGFKVYSHTDEDGMLLYIFSIIGTHSRKCVEICAGNGKECNSANLIINHGWHGLLVDGNKKLVREGIKFYRKNPNTYAFPPKFANAWVTQENVNSIIGENGFKGEIDLLIIDLDSTDYWIWKAIDVVDPRVVIVEYQDILGPDLSVTVPYSDSFDAKDYPTTRNLPNYCGASLKAFVKLGKLKGYRLVGCNRYGYNAFFIKEELFCKEIPEKDIRECFIHPKVHWGMRERFPTVKDLPWREV